MRKYLTLWTACCSLVAMRHCDRVADGHDNQLSSKTPIFVVTMIESPRTLWGSFDIFLFRLVRSISYCMINVVFWIFLRRLYAMLTETLIVSSISCVIHVWSLKIILFRLHKQIKSAVVESGVPQGRVLGPLQFLLNINELLDCVSSQVRLFADNGLLFHDHQN